MTEVDARSRRPEYLHDRLERTVDHDVLEHRVLTHVVGRLPNIDRHHQLVTYQDCEQRRYINQVRPYERTVHITFT